MRRPLLGAALAGCLLLTACSGDGFKGVYDLPLPGGADLGDHPYRITVQFADVLDLVPQAAVKVNDVPVGRVETIRLGEDGWTAEAVVAVNGDVALPGNSLARLRQSSLLGEKFVELAVPERAEGALADGAVIGVDRTNRNPEFEEVFGALSLLLNGGGISQLQTINQELTKVLDGNEPEIRNFLSTVDELVTNLDAHSGDITAALDGLNQLSATLADRDEQIDGALSNLTPGLATLAEQRKSLVTMLRSLDELSTVAIDTINRSKDDMVADLKALAPILAQLADAGQDLPNSLEILPTFPFTDPVLDAVKGDYMNVFVEIAPGEGVELPDRPVLPLPPSGDVKSLGGN
ncbi:MCE family protein [Amycolatopsis sp. 195334CR]|uniref:MCE family protein n=1 Tax=Amycolatopsis sp. 195334CR TaxID=2814588 RepID=UPI001A8E5C36|nr:MCE family protein [Amycolatopsis sp. 195334CR]MBN6033463.1 MCE family protein [Amycolatopsis sp. 195334CR]